MNIPQLMQRFYDGEKYDGTTKFYDWVRSYVGPRTRLLNLGAGPGNGDRRCSLKGEVAEVVGADIDPVVLSNPEVDYSSVIENNQLPFDDQSFDAAFSDCVLEHVERPYEFLAEVHRVLKPGASYFFRTPNNWHYVVLLARLTPYWVHRAVANRVRCLTEDACDPYPTFYRCNSRRQITQLAEDVRFSRIELQMFEGHPAYLVFHPVPFLLGVAYERCVNSSERLADLRANIFGRLVK